MTGYRKKLIELSKNYHEFFHLSFGLLSSIIVIETFPQSNKLIIIALGLIMSLLPDVDHIFYIYGYSRNTNYSKKIRDSLKKDGVKKTLVIIRNEHKNITGIYSHNLPLMLILIIGASILIIGEKNPRTAAVLLSWGFHYCYDLLEEILYPMKLNSNWWLKFKKY